MSRNRPADLDEPLDPKIANRPLEPGSGPPDLNAIMKRVRDERGPPARPAMRCSQVRLHRGSPPRRASGRRRSRHAEAEIDERRAGEGAQDRRVAQARAQADLMAAAAIMLALAGLQLGKAFCRRPVEVASNGRRRWRPPIRGNASNGTVSAPRRTHKPQRESAPTSRRQAEPIRTVAEDEARRRNGLATRHTEISAMPKCRWTQWPRPSLSCPMARRVADPAAAMRQLGTCGPTAADDRTRQRRRPPRPGT